MLRDVSLLPHGRAPAHACARLSEFGTSAGRVSEPLTRAGATSPTDAPVVPWRPQPLFLDPLVSRVDDQFRRASELEPGHGKVDLFGYKSRNAVSNIEVGIEGLPRGRIVEVYGPESSGKTTLALHVVAEAQRAGGVCAFIDAEHALDVGYARKADRVSLPNFSARCVDLF